MSSRQQPDMYGNDWINWAKEEIIALHENIKKRDAEIDALNKKYNDMKDGLNAVIQRQRISHNDYARETDREIGEAEERGARRLAEYLVHKSEYPCSSVEDLMQLWRDGRGK